jgi:hypothetical protein
MSQKSDWRRVLHEPYALGWLAFFILVVVIGVAALHSGGTVHQTEIPAARIAHGQ